MQAKTFWKFFYMAANKERSIAGNKNADGNSHRNQERGPLRSGDMDKIKPKERRSQGQKTDKAGNNPLAEGNFL